MKKKEEELDLVCFPISEEQIEMHKDHIKIAIECGARMLYSEDGLRSFCDCSDGMVEITKNNTTE